MAPSVEEWEALSPAERAAVVTALPGEVTYDEIGMPEGDRHTRAKVRAFDALRRYFTQQRRRIYISAELPTYYPDEPRFAPDLIAVLDVDDIERDKWIVSAEGKGFDWVLEIHVGGDRKQNAELNVARYARLGITEYFIHDGAENRLSAYRLASPGAGVYTPIVSAHGLYESRVLGLEVQVDEDRLRFHTGKELLLDSEERLARMQAMYDAAQRRADEEARRREEAERLLAEANQRGDEDPRRREETDRLKNAEHEIARLRAELERLRR